MAPSIDDKPISEKPRRLILNDLDLAPIVDPIPDSFLVTHAATQEFIVEIQKARQIGYGFVPFIGAGFSAPSGTPLVEDIRLYLQRCLSLALVNEDPDGNAWHPATDQWPPFIDRKHNKARRGLGFLQEKLHAQVMTLLRKGGESYTAKILTEAYGAASEWRSSLIFLSRLKHGERGERDGSVALTAPRREIIDACLRTVVQGTYPGLNHKMLGVLAGALRLNLILTTNFDDLLERAFVQARNPLEVFEVILGQHLPHWSAVSGVRSLVKLHGNRHLLRADYSLDADPSEEDKQTFLSYLVAEKGGALQRHKAGGMEFQNHLLVMGVSGDDQRTLKLVQYACESLADTFQVFWVCYTDADVRHIQEFSSRCFGPNPEDSRMTVLKHTNVGLLLLQLYQTVRRNLPPFGGLFPSISRVTLPPLQSRVAEANKDIERRFCQKIVKQLEKFQNGFEGTKLIFATSPPDVHGITSACSKVFSHMEQKSVCLWLDMNDISSTDDLFEVLLEAAYFRLGQENWVPTYRETEENKRPAEIERLMLSVDKDWIIFLNARETPGANTESEPDSKRPNGWADIPESPEKHDHPNPRSAKAFIGLIHQLCGKASSRISVVLICRDYKETPELIKQLNELEAKREAYKVLMEVSTYPFHEKEVVAQAIKWTKNDEQRQRFLHALVLMQRPRLLATIWSDVVSDDPDEPAEGKNAKPGWLEDLEHLGLVRRKAGGFVWLHSRSRELMRQALGNPPGFLEDSEANDILRKWNPSRNEPKLHTLLARWYEKVLDASRAPAAIFEAVYHLCRAAGSHLAQSEPEEGLAQARQMLHTASALLRTNSFLIQTHGYARGSCRRLNNIRRDLCKDILSVLKGRADEKAMEDPVRQLQVCCTEVMRVIAREVGEDKKAYYRHQQYGQLLAGWGLGDSKEEGRHELGSGKISQGILDRLREPGVGNGKTEAALDWVRWWRWSGMLAGASRSYPVARRNFDKALLCLVYPLEEPNADQPLPLKDLTKRLLQLQFPDIRIEKLWVEALRVIEQYVELLLLEFSLEQRLRGLHGNVIGVAPACPETKPENHLKTPEDRLEIIEKLIDAGLALVSAIGGQDQSTDSHNTMAANWCECRLLINQSICASRRRQLNASRHHPRESGGHPSTVSITPRRSVMGILGDAEASLRVSDPRRHRSELAMVELHRAESRLRKAEAVAVSTFNGKVLLFSEMVRTLSEREPPFDEQLLTQMRSNPDALRRVKSLVEDGIHFLSRVEPILRERRRNVWWTTWFFERYLRLIAMSIWASVFETGTPIPFLGLEASASGTVSVADDLFDNAQRMISVDAFRLATIIDAYANCAKALQARLMLDKKQTDISSRLEDMRQKLMVALSELKHVDRQRNSAASTEPNQKSALDCRVKAYIKKVSSEAEEIYRHLEFRM